MNYTDFSEDERKFYLSESGFDSREKEFFRLRVYEEKTLFETAEIMGYSPRTIDRISRKVKKKIVKVGRVKKRKFFHASFCFWMQQLLYFIKKCIIPLTP